MKIVIFFSITLISLFTSLSAKEILINSSAKIFLKDKDRAKKQALKNALFKSVKQSVESIMDKNIINSHHGIIKNKIYKFSENFINHYKVINEEVILKNNLYKIRINVDVNNNKIKKNLKNMRILNEKYKRKRILVFYRSTKDTLPRDSEVVRESMELANKSFAEHSFVILNEQTLKKVFSSLENEKLSWKYIDSFIALALIFNIDIIVIMEMNASQKGIYNKSFYNIMANINFSIFDTLTGQQISEINVNFNETSIKKINSSGINNL
jgi:hypothetical protein